MTEKYYEAIVVGGGHAGAEAALALARKGHKTALLSVSLDNLAYMACNPSIGGTAKGILVREIDALGGEMGINADETMLQIKSLNGSKGAAVHSLRAQSDKGAYHARMKRVLTHHPLISVLQAEAEWVLTDADIKSREQEIQAEFDRLHKDWQARISALKAQENGAEETEDFSTLYPLFSAENTAISNAGIVAEQEGNSSAECGVITKDTAAEEGQKSASAESIAQGKDSLKNEAEEQEKPTAECAVISTETAAEDASYSVDTEGAEGASPLATNAGAEEENSTNAHATNPTEIALDGTPKKPRVYGVRTEFGELLLAPVVILCCGVYLRSETVVGDRRKESGPNGFLPANRLTQSLLSLGFTVRRFKTGTPARVAADSINYAKMSVQPGDPTSMPFSFLTDGVRQNQLPCYLTYTTAETKKIILDNLHRSPLFSGAIKGTGPRYCPSIEDKVVRFADKERHQIFIEPEDEHSGEMYVQGMSSSLPADVQEAMYKTVTGLENVRILRYAYAIEYDCIDATQLGADLAYKNAVGLYSAGQINGSSGYEEAAAQGLMAGINAALRLEGKEPFVLSRSEAYIGVLIDDLVTKPTQEPYRMMTSRAEYRLLLRQDNADLRLTDKGREIGTVSKLRLRRLCARRNEIESLTALCRKILSPHAYADYFARKGLQVTANGLSLADMVRRGLPLEELLREFYPAQGFAPENVFTVQTELSYEGYLRRQDAFIEKLKKTERIRIPEDFDYLSVKGLRIEAQQKLDKIRPQTLAQASEISGVSPADIAVLMVLLSEKR